MAVMYNQFNLLLRGDLVFVPLFNSRIKIVRRLDPWLWHIKPVVLGEGNGKIRAIVKKWGINALATQLA